MQSNITRNATTHAYRKHARRYNQRTDLDDKVLPDLANAARRANSSSRIASKARLPSVCSNGFMSRSKNIVLRRMNEASAD